MEGNYSLENLSERAALARQEHQNYLLDLERKYEARCAWREERNFLPLGICGMGRAGKDTAAEFLCAQTGMVYPKSASWLALPIIATMAGVPPEQAWQERHEYRPFWISACHAFHGEDYGRLVRMCLSAGDIAVGIRGRLELEAVVCHGVVRATLWIANARAPNDITVEYGPSDCDLIVSNDGSYLEFYAKLRKLVKLLHIGVFV